MSFFKSHTLTVYRKDGSKDNYVNGYYQEGTSSTFTIECTFQPMRGKSLEPYMEGYNKPEGYAGSTYTELQLKDEIEYNGNKYVVEKVEPWMNNIINHYWFEAIKEKDK